MHTLDSILAIGRTHRITYYPCLISPFHTIRASMLATLKNHEPSHPELAELRTLLTSDVFEAIVFKSAANLLQKNHPASFRELDITTRKSYIVTAIAMEIQRSNKKHLSSLLASLVKKPS